ncbi:GNAT family N-acetyltransferase [Alteromonas oceanisediminis]|uniref:GNAT family N-acetyltransferase n=1 Tax=Alteromonas oceanisediminis TaxID=2836180 RepID=UPI001BD9E438|nr:GNAT family N-acetyltransferase [Alteromonas oceanisediminis]MBT0587384.1 GNAT family N-acetyltransferase [Alteromonas oceanisediminis]
MFSDTVIFQTKRLRCRLWVREDLEVIYSVYSDKQGARWVGDGQPISREDAIRWLDVTFKNYSGRGYGMSTVIEKATGTIVGFCGLVHPNGQQHAEIKYSFKKTHWGLGYASEIVPGMISYGNTVHGLGKIIATVADENIASQRVLQKSHMSLSDEYEENGQKILVYEWDA